MRAVGDRRPARERWGPVLLALAGGAAAALAQPPFGFLPGVFGYAAVLLALESPARGRFWPAFRRGWAAGAGYLTVSTLWVAEPFLIDAASHAWQIPFALAFCGAGVGLLWGVGGALHRLLRPAGLPLGPGAVLAFAAAFGAAEWLRGHVLTGFPWDLVGETFRAGSPLSQGAAVVGAYGLTPLVLALGAAPATLRRASGPGRLVAPALAAVALGVLGLWGEARLRAAPGTAADAPRVRVVQPDLPEPRVWSAEVFEARLDRYLALTRMPYAGAPADMVVWPEGALPVPLADVLAPGSAVPPALAAALKPGQRLVFGANRTEPGSGAIPRYFNTLAAVTPRPGGVALEATYDKHHLVPFGEYLPLRWLFAPVGFDKVLSVPGDFNAGPPPRPLRLGSVLVQPLICYEALFPDLATGDGRRAAVLLNISDDAWFGRWMGPWQHLNLASYRAIEEGSPMVRATPTGVSAVIDAYGRPGEGRLAPGRRGVIDAPLPSVAPPTLYSRVRSLAFWSVEMAATLGCLVLSRRARRANRLASRSAAA